MSVKQRIFKKSTKKGLEVFFLIDPRYTTSTVEMFFPIGWRHDPKDKIGLAHLFEHLVGKRTSDFPGKGEFSAKLSKLGIETNATTYPNSTIYFQNQSHENLTASLKLLLKAIYNSKFESEDLEKEKNVVLTEAMQYRENNSKMTWHNTTKNLFPGLTMSRFFFGDKDSLGKITVKTFEEFYNIYRNPRNGKLVIATNSSAQMNRCINIINEFFGKYPEATNVKLPVVKEKFEHIIPESSVKKEGKNQASICISYRVGKFTPKDIIMFNLVSKILTHGLTGKFIRKLRDELGLIYSLVFWRLNLKDTGMVYFQTNCGHEKKDVVVKTLLSEIKDLKIEKNDLLEILNVTKYEIMSEINSHADVDFFVKTFLSTNENITTEEYLGMLDKITSKDLNNFIKRIFTKHRSIFALE